MSNPTPSNHPIFGRLALGALGAALLCSISGAAQQSELSPYSRYGFGLIGQLQAPLAFAIATATAAPFLFLLCVRHDRSNQSPQELTDQQPHSL